MYLKTSKARRDAVKINGCRMGMRDILYVGMVYSHKVNEDWIIKIHTRRKREQIEGK